MTHDAVVAPLTIESVRRHADVGSNGLGQRPAPSTILRGAAPLLLVTIGYAIGAQLGFALQSRTGPQSILWLPNSILSAVLLVAPARRWPALLLAAFPAHLLVALQTGSPIVPMSLLFVTNCADAALGAALVRRWTHGRTEFTTLRAMVAFIALAAILSPVLLSFADAGITVATGFGDDYWGSFFTRVRSNVLTQLIVVPALVSTLLTPRSLWRAFPARRYAEAIVVLALLGLAANTLFARLLTTTAPPFQVAPTPYLLPFLFWIALRFGTKVTGAGLLLIAFVASWRVVHAPEASDAQKLDESIRGLQLFLTVMAIPLLCLAAVIRERATGAAALRESRDRIADLVDRVTAAQEAERARSAMLAEESRNLAHMGRIAAVSELTAALSHELRQPLAAIHTNAQTGVRLLAATSPPVDEIEDILRDIVADNARAANVIERIRTLMRNEPLHMRAVDLNEVCLSIGQVARSNAAVRDTRLELQLDPANPVVLGDSVQLQQVLLNLVLNGLDASARAHRERSVSVRTHVAGDRVSLAVQDSGLGFDASVASQLFEPFFSTKTDGLGMGLTIARSIVERHHGSIRADVAADGGAVFVVTLPLSNGSGAHADTPVASDVMSA